MKFSWLFSTKAGKTSTCVNVLYWSGWSSGHVLSQIKRQVGHFLFYDIYFFLCSCWLLVHPSLIHLLVSESVFSEAVPENRQMKHFLFSQQPMCFLSSVSWPALNLVLVSCLCSAAEATDSWACCVWATAAMRNACVCCPQDKKKKSCSYVHVRTDRCRMVGSRTTTAGYLLEAQLTGGLLMEMKASYLHPSTLYRSRHIYHVRVLRDPSQSICPQLKAIIFVSLRLYWLDKPAWCFRDAAVAEMNKVALACLLLFSLFRGIFCVPL